jgi:heterotetrameric sarcosine oxidase delta subunit
MRKNPKGIHLERWVCNGCRRWFNVQRDTVTDEISAVYKMGKTAPATPRKASRKS